MKSQRSWSLICGIIVGHLMMSKLVYAQSDPVVEAVKKAWKEREDRVKSFKVEIELIDHLPKGSLTAQGDGRAPDQSVLPPEDWALKQKINLSFEGYRYRYEFSGNVHARLGKGKISIVPHSRTEIDDGEEKIYLNQQSSGGMNLAAHSKSTALCAKSTEVLPVVVAFRGTNSRFLHYDLDKYRSSGRKQMIRKQECIELVLVQAPKVATHSVWVDPKRDYVLIRDATSGIPSEMSGKQIDIDYEQHPSGVWVPVKWTATDLGKTVPVMRKYEGALSGYELNVQIPKTDLDVKPLPNTIVTEVEKGKSNQVYVVESDGNQREMPGKNLASVLSMYKTGKFAPEPGEISWWDRNGIFVTGILLLVIGFSGILWVKSRNRSKLLGNPQPLEGK